MFKSLSKSSLKLQKFEIGTLYLIFAQIIFFITSYIIHILAAHLVSVTDYGRFGVTMSILGLSYVFLSLGLPESATKFISEGKDQKMVAKIVLFLQLVLSLIVSVLLYMLAPQISNYLNDKEMTQYIYLLCLIIPIRAVFHVFRSIFNGLERFRISSFLSLLNSFIKLIFSFSLMLMGYKIIGVLWSYILAALVPMLLAIIVMYNIGLKGGHSISYKEFFNFTVPLIFLTFFINLILDLDILLVKLLISNPEQAGFYNSSKTISTIPVGIALAFSSTVLPKISRHKSFEELNEIKLFVTRLINYMLVIFLPFGVIVSSNSSHVLSLFFPEEYSESVSSLEILSISFIFLAFFIILSSVFNGLGKPQIPLVISFFMVIIYILISYYMIQDSGIRGASLASLFCNFIGFSILLIFLKFHTSAILFSKLSLLFTFFNVIFYSFLMVANLTLIPLIIALFSFVIIYSNLIIKFKIFNQ